jgi:hypothetical protein
MKHVCGFGNERRVCTRACARVCVCTRAHMGSSWFLKAVSCGIGIGLPDQKEHLCNLQVIGKCMYHLERNSVDIEIRICFLNGFMVFDLIVFGGFIGFMVCMVCSYGFLGF